MYMGLTKTPQTTRQMKWQWYVQVTDKEPQTTKQIK